MRIPVYLAIAQWVLLLTLGVLVILMFRQLGRHLSVARTPPDLGPALGSPAAVVEYEDVAAGGGEFFRPGDGRATLLAFVDPTCPSCEELVAIMNAAHADGELEQVRALLLISEPPTYLKISDPFRETRLPVGRILADATLEAYRVSATPLLVAIDGAGFVRAAGPAGRRAELRAFVSACLLASPQAPTLPVTASVQDGPNHDMMTAIAGEERGERR